LWKKENSLNLENQQKDFNFHDLQRFQYNYDQRGIAVKEKEVGYFVTIDDMMAECSFSRWIKNTGADIWFL